MTEPMSRAGVAPAPTGAAPTRAARTTAALTVAALSVAAPAACTGTSPPPSTGPPTASTAAWEPVFSDEFDGAANTGLSPEDWIYSLGTGYRGGAAQWGTGELETMTDSVANVHHDGAGHLTIRPIRSGTGVGRWTSGRVETRRTDFAAPPGGAVRMEATLKLPDVTGTAAAGYWSAFWALGAPARPVGATNWPKIGEWDVMEHTNGLDAILHTLHCGVAVGGPCGEPTGISSGKLPCQGCRTAFHTYAIEYDRSVTPEVLRWYVDDRNTFTVSADRVDPATWAAANQHGFFMILNVAIGGAFPAAFGGGPTPATRSGVPMIVDRVAVSTRAGRS